MAGKTLSIVIIIVAVVVVANSAFFALDETELAIVTQFGKYIRSVEDPGLHLKLPFIQNLQYFDKRVLEYDASPAEVLTKDKKNLVVDNYARWRITDPLRFYQTVKNEAGAQDRLNDIIYADVREEMAKHDLSEIIDIRRQGIMDAITKKTALRAQQYGIKIIDVRIKRADLPPEVEESVYKRMRAERERIAKKYRSEGEEEAAKIRAETDKERAIILAEAYKEAEGLRGEGDAKATTIYAQAFTKDPEFYQFLRTLESYKKVVDKETTFILNSDSQLFKYLEKSDK